MIDGKKPSELFQELAINLESEALLRSVGIDPDSNPNPYQVQAIYLGVIMEILDRMDREYSKRISAASDPRNWAE